MAPAESRHTASRAPEPPRDDPFAELSPGTVSAAPLLHPQRQRELIEQAAGMSTRQVAGLLAAAAPEVLPPPDTLRAVGFGLPVKVPSWGGMLSREGRQYMEQAPRLALWPGLCLTIIVYSLNMFGDAVRDLLDPRLRGGGSRLGATAVTSV